MKKILSLVLAVMMIAVVGLASAAETTKQRGTETTEVTFTIAKDIVLFNTNSQPIYEPNVTYTYALTSVNPNRATITDDPAATAYDADAQKSVTVAVKAGTGGVTITGTDGVAKGVGDGDINVVFGDGVHDATASYAYQTNAEGSTVTANSKKATRNITVTIDPASDAFKETKSDNTTSFVPGVYRYHIAETSNTANVNGKGVKTPEGRLTDLTLDVYLRWNTDKTALQVYGYVLFRDLTETDSLTYDSSTATTAKVTGFDIASNLVDEHDSATTSTADEYHTYNIKISKDVAGNMADTNNAFPFRVNLTGIENSEYYWTKGTDTNKTLCTLGSGSEIVQRLKHGEYFTIYGLPYNATVGVTETNNTYDYYIPTATYTAGTAAATDITSELTIANSFAPNSTAVTESYNNSKAANAKTLNDALTEDVIAFTNTLREISPTGYVARFAPYALILVAGIILLIVAKKRKPAEEE